MIDREFDRRSEAHSRTEAQSRPEPAYRKRRRSDLRQLNVMVEPQSFVDAHAVARSEKKSTGEYVCELIRKDVARRVAERRKAA